MTVALPGGIFTYNQAAVCNDGVLQSYASSAVMIYCGMTFEIAEPNRYAYNVTRGYSYALLRIVYIILCEGHCLQTGTHAMT